MEPWAYATGAWWRRLELPCWRLPSAGSPPPPPSSDLRLEAPPWGECQQTRATMAVEYPWRHRLSQRSDLVQTTF